MLRKFGCLTTTLWGSGWSALYRSSLSGSFSGYVSWCRRRNSHFSIRHWYPKKIAKSCYGFWEKLQPYLTSFPRSGCRYYLAIDWKSLLVLSLGGFLLRFILFVANSYMINMRHSYGELIAIRWCDDPMRSPWGIQSENPKLRWASLKCTGSWLKRTSLNRIFFSSFSFSKLY